MALISLPDHLATTIVQAATAAPSPPITISRGEQSGGYQAFPDICRLRNGDLLCVFYAGYGHVSLPKTGWPKGGRICAVRSADEGRSWSQPVVVYDGLDDDRDPHVAQLNDGSIVCSFFPYRRRPDGRIEYETSIVQSRDGGWSWESDHRVLAPGWACSAPVRELPDGTRLLGVYHEEGNTAYGGVLRSMDAGKTWSEPIPIGKGSGVRLDAETDIVRLQDGTLYAALRGDKTNMHYATSTDAGLTWSGVRDIGFAGHCPHFTRLQSGTILLTHRLPQTALHVSHDEGLNWQGPLILDSTPGAYPSTLELPDHSILAVYYEEGAGSTIRARRFRIANGALEFLPLEITPRPIGSRLELFVDRTLIDRMDGCALRLHSPQLEGVALKFDAPWEGAFSGYVTVLHDLDRGLYRMYYRGLPIAGKDGSTNEVTCCAESQDGTRWIKPALGLFEVGGTRSNNVVLAGQAPFSHNFAPFLDRNPASTPEQRFKALAGTSEAGLHAFASADGLNWRRLHNTPVLTKGAFDSQNVAFWSESENCYVLYLRTWTQGGFAGYRTISRSVSTNFIDWTLPREMNFGHAPIEHLYTSQTHPYFRAPHLYLSTPMRFVPGRQVLTANQALELGVQPGYAGDAAEAVFMTSRGGLRYERTFLEGFIRPGLDPGNWASRAGLTALGIVPNGGKQMSLYKQAHYAQPSCHLLRYSLRTDGFASINAPLAGGEFVTHPLTFDGSQLALNFSTGAAGSLRVEIQNSEGKPHAGYALTDCAEVVGDDIARVVGWNNKSTIKLPRNQPVRLRFVLRDADLFSLQFRESIGNRERD